MLSGKAVDIKGNRTWKVIVEPTLEPVTVEELKTFARIDGVDEDSLLETFIISIRKKVEYYLGKSLIQQTIRLTMDEWNSNIIELPMSPLISVSSVTTIDEDDTETTYSSSNYYVITESIPGQLVIKDSASNPINTVRCKGGYRITYLAGYGSLARDVPSVIKTSIMVGATKLYENRDFTEELPTEVKVLLQMFKADRGLKR
jgi:uncharacterized phiE125 gp8 family phage protein